MRLSLDLLGYSLSRKTEVHIYRRLETATSRKLRKGALGLGESYGRPVLALAEPGERTNAAINERSMAGRVVVLNADMLERLLATNGLAVDALYLCAGPAPEAWTKTGSVLKSHVISAPSETAGQLLNLVQETFDLFDCWESDLTRILLEGGGFQAILEASDPVMFHPLALQDNDFHLIAFSGMAREHGILEYFANGRSLTPEVVGNMVRGGAYARIVDNVDPYAFDLREVKGIALNLRHQGKFEGFLIVNVPEMDDALAAYYGGVLNVLGSYVSRLLDDRGRFESHWMTSNELRRLFASGLRGEPLDPISWRKALIDSGWSAGAAARVLCMCPEDASDGAIGYLKKAIDQKWPGVATVLQGDKLAVLASEEGLTRELDPPSGAELDLVFQELRIRIGASRPLRNSGNLETAFKEAEQAMGLAPIWDGIGTLVRFEEVTLEVLVGKAAEKLPVESLCLEALLELKRIDESSKTEYFNTVKAYLDSRLNAAAASRELNIQRSTFFYRLNRIKELTGLDVEKAESEQLTHIALSVWMLDRK